MTFVGCINHQARSLIIVKMKGSHIIATTSLVIIQRFCLGDIEKYVCKKDHRYDKYHATHFTCKDDPGNQYQVNSDLYTIIVPQPNVSNSTFHV